MKISTQKMKRYKNYTPRLSGSARGAHGGEWPTCDVCGQQEIIIYGWESKTGPDISVCTSCSEALGKIKK